jgi:hypothetical protein
MRALFRQHTVDARNDRASEVAAEQSQVGDKAGRNRVLSVPNMTGMAVVAALRRPARCMWFPASR